MAALIASCFGSLDDFLWGIAMVRILERDSPMRPLRIQQAGLIYHVMGRGNDKTAIYLDDLDRLRFIAILNDVLSKYEVDCWAGCEMGNHYHLILRTREANISSAMRQLNGCYAQWRNHRREYIGHLFQGRFKGQIVQDGAYLLRVTRYVLLNPVRGELCRTPGEWPWSTYGALAGASATPWRVDIGSLLARFGPGSSEELRREFVRYVRGDDPEMAEWIRGDVRVIGSDSFVRQFRERAAAASKEVPRVERRIGTPPLLEVLTSSLQRGAGLNTGIVIAHRDYCYSVEDIARCAGISARTISRLLRRDLPDGAVTAID